MSFYQYITEKRNDNEELKSIMETVASSLKKHKTDEIKPGVLLGLINREKRVLFWVLWQNVLMKIMMLL
ncbi:hypothetical protein [Chryseobacterium sp. 8AT]|uniref:hypothetical protein n=1 Tax=Chryseobacterium sp. 8AT TaxID=2653134 RepID=UPI0012EFBC73|nr:hypothetical protein [Chryseobacterium sp. 8AT]VXC43789.1 hypothetical protein CHRYSEO8AT_550058 [Chryseobacterium sp. 8AT]